MNAPDDPLNAVQLAPDGAALIVNLDSVAYLEGATDARQALDAGGGGEAACFLSLVDEYAALFHQLSDRSAYNYARGLADTLRDYLTEQAT